MNHPDAWQRLAAAARHSPAEGDTSAPYGFATRVAALGLASPAESIPFFGSLSLSLSLRALAAACLLAVTTAAFSYSEIVTFSHGALPAPTQAWVAPNDATLPAAKAAPAPTEAPAANASSDDPVSDLMNLVS